MSSDTKTVAIVGLGFVGMRAFRELSGDKKINLVAIDAKDYFENVPASVDYLMEPNVATNSLVEYSTNPAIKAVFKQGLVSSIASDGVTGSITMANGETVSFDYAILGTGSTYPGIKASPGISTTKAERVGALTKQKEAIAAAKGVGVVGGSSVGVEVAAAIAETFPGKDVTLVISGDRVLDKFAPAASEYATTWLSKKGVNLIYRERVVDWGGLESDPIETTVKTDKGTTLSGLVFKCIGVKPSTVTIISKKKDSEPVKVEVSPSGQIPVTSTLQVEGLPNVFAAGDVAGTAEEKTANYADYAGQAVGNNVKALVYGKEPSPFPEGWFKGQGKLPFSSGATLGKRDGIMQMGNDVQKGAMTGYMRSFFGKMILGSAAGYRIWGALYAGIKGMFAGQLAAIAAKQAAT